MSRVLLHDLLEKPGVMAKEARLWAYLEVV